MVAKPLSDPRRSSSTVENADDSILHAIIDRKREAFAQAAMIAEDARVNSAVVGEQFDVREKRFEKVITQSGNLAFVETKACNEIPLRVWEDFDPHVIWRRISALALSHSTNFAWPEST